MPATVDTAATVIGVSAGRVDRRATGPGRRGRGADGREVTGILVADPEQTDKTTGRVPHLTRTAATQAAESLEGRSNGDQTVNDPDRSAAWPAGIDGELPEYLWAPAGSPPMRTLLSTGLAGGLVSLAFIGEALRRATWVWCITAVLGLVIGTGLYVS